MANKSSGKPSNARYKSDNRKLKNKIRKLNKYVKDHPNDKQTASVLQKLQGK